MPRPRKCRRVCCLPRAAAYAPVDAEGVEDAVVLTVDEFETLRLIDTEGLSQEECSAYMQVARTTVQQIYLSARQKLSQALVAGRPFKIEGGDYRLCDGAPAHCAFGGCWRSRQAEALRTPKKGGAKMIVSMPVDENKQEVCVSFARAPFFLLSDEESKEQKFLVNPAAAAEGGAGIQAAQFLVDQGATALLTVRCGENAAEVLQAAEIGIYKTEGPTVAENLAAFREGKLAAMTKFHAGYHGIR